MSRALRECAGREDVLRCLGRLALPELGDWCDVDLLRDGALQRVAAFRSPNGTEQGPPVGPPSLLARRVAETGVAELLFAGSGRVAWSLASAEGEPPKLETEGLLDCLAVPLRLGGQLLGVLSFATRDPARRFGQDTLALAEELACGLAFALETYRLREELAHTCREAEQRAQALTRELQRQVSEFQTLLEVIPVGIGIAHDRECKRIRQNPWFARLHALPLDSNISLSAPEGELQPIRYLHQGRALRPEELPMQRAAATGQTVLDVELDLEVQGQRRGTLVVSAVPLFDEARRPRGAIGTIQDVTARKRAMEAQRFLAESSAVLSSSLDPEETARTLARLCVPALANVAALFGWRPDGSLGVLSVAHEKPSAESFITEASRDLALPPHDPIHEAMVSGRAEFFAVVNDPAVWRGAQDDAWQALRWRLGLHSLMLIPLSTSQGVAGVLMLGSSERTYTEDDFTFAKEYAAHATYAVDNARLYREAREAISLREEFLGIAGHELRTPLTALQLGLQSLARHTDDSGNSAGLARWVSTCQRQGARLGKLVGDLLDVSRIASGRLPMVAEEMDLSVLVEEVAARMGQELDKAHCTLSLKLESPLVGRWDRSRLDQVLTNLLSNAMKYGQGWPIEVRASSTPEGVRLCVRDEGIGISADDQARIFERFERAVPERHYGGLGLGLWITRQIVSWLGGHIHVESEQGRGSTFTVELPRRVEG